MLHVYFGVCRKIMPLQIENSAYSLIQPMNRSLCQFPRKLYFLSWCVYVAQTLCHVNLIEMMKLSLEL